ncbi:hypothetical protein TNCV_3750191 [Trichonephila clavipes]|nr:hypothetical protein TNCV_3750191 [Trichonephila clavipes]
MNLAIWNHDQVTRPSELCGTPLSKLSHYFNETTLNPTADISYGSERGRLTTPTAQPHYERGFTPFYCPSNGIPTSGGHYPIQKLDFRPPVPFRKSSVVM